jgi:Gluconate 2-dehydrogenase subunit 3
MHSPTLLSRREAIARLGLALGGALVIGSESYLRGTPLEGKTTLNDFSATDLALLDEIGDTIIPATDTPGAKSVKIGAFMAMMVNDCYDDANHTVFRAGLPAINDASRAKFGHDFIAATPAERTALLNELDATQKQQQATKAKGAPPHYFRMMKQLTLLGYFSSEVGATQAMRFVEVPGRYDGNAPYQKGDRAWFVPTNRAIL